MTRTGVSRDGEKFGEREEEAAPEVNKRAKRDLPQESTYLSNRRFIPRRKEEGEAEKKGLDPKTLSGRKNLEGQ